MEELFERWAAQVPHVVRGWELEPVEFPLAVPGAHNRLNAAAALAALELAGVPRARRRRRSRASAARRGGSSSPARPAACAVYDDYAHHPTELAATIAAARELGPGRVLVLFQPHLPSRTRHLARELGAALAAADAACVTEVYAAREEPSVSGRSVVAALSEARPGMAIGWAPALEDAAHIVAGWARSGRPRAGRGRRRRRPRRPAAPGRRSREDRGGQVSLSAFTTIGTGGPALAFAPAGKPRRARAGARVGGRARPPRRDGRARLEPARRRRRRGRRSCSGSKASSPRPGRTASSCSPAAGRRTPSASTARVPPGSAASSSPARSRARPAAASG